MAVTLFPIPASLQDLEREPYNLLPYPNDFEDDDEAARADSFAALVGLIERGNRSLETAGSVCLPLLVVVRKMTLSTMKFGWMKIESRHYILL